MAQDKLTSTDKVKILDLLKNKKSVKGIARTLKKSEELIENYISELESVFTPKVKVIVQSDIESKILNELVGKLREYGLTDDSIQSKLDKISETIDKEVVKKATLTELYDACIKVNTKINLFINKTAGGKKGVAIQTEASSELEQNVTDKNKRLPNTYQIFNE